MTILPKKKSSTAKNDRDPSVVVDSVPFPPRALAQNQVRNFFLLLPFLTPLPVIVS